MSEVLHFSCCFFYIRIPIQLVPAGSGATYVTPYSQRRPGQRPVLETDHECSVMWWRACCKHGYTGCPTSKQPNIQEQMVRRWLLEEKGQEEDPEKPELMLHELGDDKSDDEAEEQLALCWSARIAEGLLKPSKYVMVTKASKAKEVRPRMQGCYREDRKGRNRTTFCEPTSSIDSNLYWGGWSKALCMPFFVEKFLANSEHDKF